MLCGLFALTPPSDGVHVSDGHNAWCEEAIVAKRAGVYRSEKRKKELMRQKKQEEKREKRFKKDTQEPQSPAVTEQEAQAQE